MPLHRDIPLTCPTCGHEGRYALEPTEDRPLVALVRCEACATPFGVEVRLTILVETAVCRLALPSTTPVEPAATSAGGAIPPAPAYEARVLTPEASPELPLERDLEDVRRTRRVASPLDQDVEDMPLAPDLDVTQESAVPEMSPADGPDWRTAETWAQAMRDRPLAVTEDLPVALDPTEATQDAVPAAPAEVVKPSRSRKAARPKAAAKPKTARTTKGHK